VAPRRLGGVESDPGAVLILAGGEGRRLGGPKAWIDWQGQPLLLVLVHRLAVLGPLYVVARQGQQLPPAEYRRVDDRLTGAGPLAGLAAGLDAIASDRPAARIAVAACDYPFAEPELFRALAASDPLADLVLPRWGGHLHPLHGLWRARAGAICDALLAGGERRVQAAVDRLGGMIVDADRLTGLDPARSLLNVNDAATLARARALAAAP
jgi:molybdopterin-guanine dinucleotide biosynthesis protein A